MLGAVTDPDPGDLPPDPQPTDPDALEQERPPGALNPQIGGLLAYLLGWVSGLVVFFTQTDREVRFHAAQSVIVFGGLNVFLLFWTFAMGPGDGSGFAARALFALSWLLIAGLSLAVWGFLCFQGYTLEHFKVPVAGDLAEQWEARQPPGVPR
jgi:uncharacterized membrane protein